CRRLVYQAHLLRHWWFSRHSPYQTFFTIATARSGSNLLVDYLDGLPGVQSLSEILNWRTRIGPRREVPTHGAIRHIRVSMQTLQSPLRGCKLFLSDLEDFRLTLEDLDREFPDA